VTFWVLGAAGIVGAALIGALVWTWALTGRRQQAAIDALVSDVWRERARLDAITKERNAR